MRRAKLLYFGLLAALMGLTAPAHAIGWDSDDFLIGGGPSFTTKIGVFDHDLTFKGLLDGNFATVAGMDFDAAGHLVAVAGALRTVRVYDSSGAIVGGFTRGDNLLGTPGDLKVARNGNYIVATQNFGGGDGAREFTPEGTFVRQYGSGWTRGAAIVSGSRLWTAGVGSTAINVFDLEDGSIIGTIPVPGLMGVNSMSYSVATNTVLLTETQLNKVLELDLDGSIIHTFNAPSGVTAVTRGPNGDVFATTSNQSILHWQASGEFLGSTSTSATIGGSSAIVWAGSIPEPRQMATAPLILLSLSRLWRLTNSRQRSSS